VGFKGNFRIAVDFRIARFQLPAVGFKAALFTNWVLLSLVFQLPAVGFKEVFKSTSSLNDEGFSFQQWDLKLDNYQLDMMYQDVSASSSGI